MRTIPHADPTGPLPPVLLTHEYAPFRGGVATYVEEIAYAAVRLGLPVEVWTVNYRGRVRGANDPGKHGDSLPSGADAAWPFPVIRFASSGRLTPGGLLGLGWGVFRRRRQLRRRPVVLLSVGAQMVFFVLGLLGCVDAGRTTCFFHGSEILRFRRNAIWRWLARRFYARAGGFAANSFHVEQLLRASGLLPDRAVIRVAPCACPSSFFDMAEPTAAVGNDDGFQRVLTVARLHPRKGQLEVARALALLPPERRARVVYQMVGTGDATYRQQVEDACRTGGVRCEFLGVLDAPALRAAYRQATVYAQASLTLPQSVEGFGITFLEASFHGCPVAAYRSGGVSEAVRDGETGLLVPEGDLLALTAAVGRLLDEPLLRTRMGEAGRTFARGFHWEESAQALCADPALASA